jgi:hypothetical protein
MKIVGWLAGVAIAVAGFAPAQDELGFVERARAGTEKYRDQSAAVIDGYRRIGRDFPAMGEHWIRINLLFDGKIEAEHPEFLTYIQVLGKPRLLGTAYALPLLPGESSPDFPVRAAWHDHFRTVEDETILPHHHLSANAANLPRLAMLHAWIWAPNPDGMFAADNWAIPYMRLGIEPPVNQPRSAALVLSLLNGGAQYFATVIDKAASLNSKQRTGINSSLAAATSAAEDIIARHTDGNLTVRELGKLSTAWIDAWKSIEDSIPRDKRPDVRTVLPKW